MNNIRQIALNCCVKKIGYRQSKDGIVVSFLVHHAEMPDKLAIADLGTPYMMALVEIDDNDQPAAQERNRPEAEPLPGGAAAVQAAGALCKDKRFQTFLQEDFAGGWKLFSGRSGGDDECATKFVRWRCGVQSRSEIKTNPDALARWRELHGLYSAWGTL